MKRLFIKGYNGLNGADLYYIVNRHILISNNSNHRRIFKTNLTLALLLALTICRTECLSQQETWSSFQDIRQLTELATDTNREIIKYDKGVTLSSRWLTFGDSISTRELSLHFVVDTDIERVLINIIYPEKIMEWNDEVGLVYPALSGIR
jgi:hypothetical protein